VTGPHPKRSGNPATRANASRAPVSPAREQVSARSRNVLARLAALPPLVIPGLMLVLMLVGLTAPLPVAVTALVIIAAFVSWLAYLSWPVLDTRGRLLRGVMGVAIAVALVGRLTGWL
jgi:hypothetical protein